MASNSLNKSSDSVNQTLSLKEYVQTCLRKWIWFVVSMVVCLSIGYLYIKCQEPVYERSEEILIKDQSSGSGIGAMSNAFSSMGLISGNTNVFNELISMSSPAVLAEVIDRLHLDVDYVQSGLFHGTTLYGTTLPFEVKFLDLDDMQSASFECEVAPDGSMRLYKFVSYTPEGKKIKHSEEVANVKVGNIVNTPLGKVQFVKNDFYNPVAKSSDDKDASVEIDVAKSDMQSAIETYSKKVTGDLKDEYADVIILTMKDVNVERAVDVLTNILSVYNEEWVEDKNKIAKATSSFIEDRLRVIEKELGEADINVAKQSSAIGTVTLHEKGAALLQKDEAFDRQLISLNNNLAWCKYMYEYLKDSNNKFNILPINSGAQSEEVEVQINTYNELLLARNALESGSSDANPLVKDYDTQLANLRTAILKGMSNNIKRFESLIASAEKEQAKARGSLREAPLQTLPLLSEQRQQSVKQNLYLFLLEKREENELSQKFTADNTRLITPPMGSLKPVSPKKMFIMLFAFVLGLAIPVVTLYIMLTSDTKVRAKKDLEGVKMPFAGEIPQVGKPTKFKAIDAMDKLRHKEEKAPLAVVEEGKRDVVNEAFRVIRSNLDFMSGKNSGKAEVIMLTSFNPGSGKSFVSYNLALSFAIKKKRVLLVDLDLRHGSSSMYVGMPHKGITNYLTDATDDWRSLVKKSNSNPAVDILPVGKMPPNPAELLENDRMERLLDEARPDYDVIILDCPPVNIVVDAQIVGQWADRTLFVVRAGLLEKSALQELNEFYEEKKFKNMSVLLNGTAATHSRYYTYGNYQNFND